MKKHAFELSHMAQLHYLHVRRKERCNRGVETNLSRAEIVAAKISASPHESQIYGKTRKRFNRASTFLGSHSNLLLFVQEKFLFYLPTSKGPRVH